MLATVHRELREPPAICLRGLGNCYNKKKWYVLPTEETDMAKKSKTPKPMGYTVGPSGAIYTGNFAADFKRNTLKPIMSGNFNKTVTGRAIGKLIGGKK